MFKNILLKVYVGSQSYHFYQFLLEIERVLAVCSTYTLRFRTAVHGAYPVKVLIVIVAQDY